MAPARLIRRVNIEENINIDIDLEGLRCDPETYLNRYHCAVSTITYPENPDTGEQEETGWLIYLKPTITAAEKGAVKAYWWTHQDDHFPHQTTLDQFYDDDQFEAYRRLGEQTILHTFDSWRGWYDKQYEDNRKNGSSGARTAFKQIIHLLGKADEPSDTLKRIKLMRAIFEHPAEKLLTELSKELILKEVINDLKTVTTV